MAASLVNRGLSLISLFFNVYNTGDVDITKLRNQERLDELRAESMRILEMHESTLKDRALTVLLNALEVISLIGY